MSNFNGVVVQIQRLVIKPGVKRVWTSHTLDEVEQWLTQRTCENNFKSVLAANLYEALDACRRQIRLIGVPPTLRLDGVKPEHFVFSVSITKVTNGWFWITPDTAESKYYCVDEGEQE